MEHIVTAEESGRRLRDILRQVMQVSYSAMKSAKWDKRILINGEPRAVDQIVHEGDTVAFLLPDALPVYTPSAYSISLNIPYEDDHLLVIDKPAPLASQSSARQADNTLENAVYSYFGCPENFIYRPVNRLDKGTSGLMIIAKDAHTQQLFQRMLHTADFTRRYLAIVDGIPTLLNGTITAPIAKEDTASIRRIVTPGGKMSVTHYETLCTKNGRSLIRLQLETGRTHQIRVHMSHIGCPVSGDFLYGKELSQLPGRFALHSAEISVKHPITGKQLHIESALPESLAALMHESEEGGTHGTDNRSC